MTIECFTGYVNREKNAMEITDLINSQDMRTYLRDIHYSFSTPEAAIVVYLNGWLSLKEKEKAWETIIASMPDCAMQERTGMTAIDSFHGFLKAFIELQEKRIRNFCRSENNCIYGFSRYDRDYGWLVEDQGLFSDYRSCAAYCQSNVLFKGETDWIRIYKHKLDQAKLKPADEILLNKKMEILDTLIYFEEKRDSDIGGVFDAMCFDFPTPFQRGDILIPCKTWRSCKHDPFVLSYLTTWDSSELMARGFTETECPFTAGWREFDRARDEMLERGDICDMRAYGTVVTENGMLYADDILTSPLDLEFFREEPVGMQRQLTIFSEFEKKKIDGELLSNCCAAIRAEESAKESLRYMTSCYGYGSYMKILGMIAPEDQNRAICENTECRYPDDRDHL